jgi:hypothetical protein
MVTLLSRALFQSGDGNVFVFRLASLLPHFANCVLLYFLLSAFIPSRFMCAATTAFFAVHPIQVEAVVWAAGHKNLQATFVALIALLALISLFHTSSSFRNTLKTPLVLFASLLDFFSKRNARVRIAVAGCFLIALLSFSFHLNYAFQDRTIHRNAEIGFAERLLGTEALVSRIYLKNILIPFNLAPIYEDSLRWQRLTLPHLLTAAALLLLFWLIRRSRGTPDRNGLLLSAGLGLLAFLPYAKLFPVEMAAADRYFYVACLLPLFVLALLLESGMRTTTPPITCSGRSASEPTAQRRPRNITNAP